MKSNSTPTPSRDPGLKRLMTGTRWAAFMGLVASAVLLASIFPGGGEAATSPTLVGSASYSVLGGAAVTCTGSTTTTGAVGVSPGTSITGFPSPCTAGGGTQSNNASAIAAQADNLTAFGTLNQTCDQSFGAVDLSTTNFAGFGVGTVGPGVYCSTSSFTLSGNLNLTGSGVWIFKTVSTLITSPGSSVTGGDPCNVWWRIGSAATLDTTTSFIGNILALNGVTAMKTGATLNGRILAQAAATVTLDSNTITGPTCTALAATALAGEATQVVAAGATQAAKATATQVTAATATQAAKATGTQVAAAAATQAAAPTSTATPTTPTQGVRPPQSGDAGLLQDTRSGRPAAGIAFAAVFLLGAVALARLRPKRGQA
jgi:hypothetical protein